MRDAIPRLFAEITATLEDMHSIAVEGQRGDNVPEMQRVLSSQLRMGVVSLDRMLAKVKRRLGDDHE